MKILCQAALNNTIVSLAVTWDTATPNLSNWIHIF